MHTFKMGDIQFYKSDSSVDVLFHWTKTAAKYVRTSGRGLFPTEGVNELSKKHPNFEEDGLPIQDMVEEYKDVFELCAGCCSSDDGCMLGAILSTCFWAKTETTVKFSIPLEGYMGTYVMRVGPTGVTLMTIQRFFHRFDKSGEMQPDSDEPWDITYKRRHKDEEDDESEDDSEEDDSDDDE